jgi:hypothetical protein
VNNTDRKKLDRIERALEDALALVRELRSNETEEPTGVTKQAFDGAEAARRIRELGRQNAEAYLDELKQSELGSVFVAAGGPGVDKKKPKQWLVEQILWRIFDFEAGHNAIRGIGAGEA